MPRSHASIHAPLPLLARWRVGAWPARQPLRRVMRPSRPRLNPERLVGLACVAAAVVLLLAL